MHKISTALFQTAHTSGVMARSASSSSDHNNNSRQCSVSRGSCGKCLFTNCCSMSTLLAGYTGTSPNARQRGATVAQHTIHLWQFLRELLDADCISNDRPVVRWLDRGAGELTLCFIGSTDILKAHSKSRTHTSWRACGVNARTV